MGESINRHDSPNHRDVLEKEEPIMDDDRVGLVVPRSFEAENDTVSYKPHTLLPKEKALPNVLQWLVNTFEMASSCALPKRDVYEDYLAFCLDHHLEATNAPAFGKILRMVFPDITSRRLGRRGQTSHHYNHFRRRPAGQPPAQLHLTGGLLSALTAGLGWAPSTSSPPPLSASSSSSDPSSVSGLVQATTSSCLLGRSPTQHRYQHIPYDHPFSTTAVPNASNAADVGAEGSASFLPLRHPHQTMQAMSLPRGGATTATAAATTTATATTAAASPPASAFFPSAFALDPAEVQKSVNPFSSFSYLSSEVATSPLFIPVLSAQHSGGEALHFILHTQQIELRQDAEAFSSLYRGHLHEVAQVLSGAYLDCKVLQALLSSFYAQLKRFHRLLSFSHVVSQVVDSDRVFYNWVAAQLVPDVLSDVGEEHESRVLDLADTFYGLIRSAMMTHSLPHELFDAKMKAAARFGKTLRSRAVITRLSTQLKSALGQDADRQEEMTSLMLDGWQQLDCDFIDEKTMIYGRFRNIAVTFREGFLLLLQHRGSLNFGAAWLLRLAGSVAKGDFLSQAHSTMDFMLKWGVCGHLMLCNLAVLRADHMHVFCLFVTWAQTLLGLYLEEQEAALRARAATDQMLPLPEPEQQKKETPGGGLLLLLRERPEESIPSPNSSSSSSSMTSASQRLLLLSSSSSGERPQQQQQQQQGEQRSAECARAAHLVRRPLRQEDQQRQGPTGHCPPEPHHHPSEGELLGLSHHTTDFSDFL